MKALICSFETCTAKNGSDYYRVRLVNEEKTEVAAVAFDIKDMNPFVGKICEVTINKSGQKSGQNSDKIEGLVVLENENINNYIRCSKYDVDMMLSEIKSIMLKESPSLYKIVEKVMLKDEKRLERFKTWPAANTMHHGFKSGLIEHTWSMLKMAQALRGQDPALDGLDFGIIYAAVIIHDVAKIVTYDFEPAKGADRNRFESLLGHISLADEFIVRAALSEKLPTTEGAILHLRHCVLSHHGRKEWGSPVAPSTREAVFVHSLDHMQARNEMALEALVGVKDGMKSAFNRGLETELFKV